MSYRSSNIFVLRKQGKWRGGEGNRCEIKVKKPKYPPQPTTHTHTHTQTHADGAHSTYHAEWCQNSAGRKERSVPRSWRTHTTHTPLLAQRAIWAAGPTEREGVSTVKATRCFLTFLRVKTSLTIREKLSIFSPEACYTWKLMCKCRASWISYGFLRTFVLNC